MPTQEKRNILDSLLNQANKAVIDRQWNTAQVLAEEVLKLDEGNSDAQSIKNTSMQVVVYPPIVNATMVLPDPDLPESPSDPNDAVYFSIHPSHFIGHYPERFHYDYASVYLRNHLEVFSGEFLYAPLTVPDGLNIWGWRCVVLCYGGFVNVDVMKGVYKENGGLSIQLIGETQSSGNRKDIVVLSMTGLSSRIDNRKESYWVVANLSSTNPPQTVGVGNFTLICRPY